MTATDAAAAWYVTVSSSHPAAIPASLLRSLVVGNEAPQSSTATKIQGRGIEQESVASWRTRKGSRKPLQVHEGDYSGPTQLDLFRDGLTSPGIPQTESEPSSDGNVDQSCTTSHDDLAAPPDPTIRRTSGVADD